MAGQLKVGGNIIASHSGVEGAGEVTLQNVTLGDSAVPSRSMNFRNRIINGDMRIDQRNAGASVTPTVTYTLDRWSAIHSGNTNKFSVQQNAGAVTPPVGFTNYLGVVSLSAHSLAANDYYQIKQVIEGFNVADFDWGTANARSITVSFWVRSSLTGNFGVVVSWGSSGSNQRTYPILYSITSADTWEYKTITIPGDTTMAAGGFETGNGGGVQLRFSLGGGATSAGTSGSWAAVNYQTVIGDTSVVSTNGATFYITGVQLEEGTVPTPFEHRPIGTELALCQRYYSIISSVDCSAYFVAGQNAPTFNFSYPQTMRATPAITISRQSNDSTNLTSIVQRNQTPNSFNLYLNGTATGVANFGHNGNEATLLMDAEL